MFNGIRSRTFVTASDRTLPTGTAPGLLPLLALCEPLRWFECYDGSRAGTHVSLRRAEIVSRIPSFEEHRGEASRTNAAVKPRGQTPQWLCSESYPPKATGRVEHRIAAERLFRRVQVAYAKKNLLRDRRARYNVHRIRFDLLNAQRHDAAIDA